MMQLAPIFSFTYDGANIMIFHADKGSGLPKHQHTYAHATFCMSGSCFVRKDGKELLIDKNTQPLNLLENEWHEIEAAEDNTVFVNVFAVGKY